MQNYILISRTFSEITPESVEDGDFSDHGYISEREEITFSELVQLMKRHYQPSQYPNDGNPKVWYSTGYEIEDYCEGTQRQESIHLHPDNTPNVAKYWRRAALYAGLIK